MRGIILAICVGIIFSTYAQNKATVTSELTVYKHWKVNFSEGDDKIELSALQNHETAPRPIMTSDLVKQQLDAKRQRTLAKNKTSYFTSKGLEGEKIAKNFNGKPIGVAGIPNDNTMAISNNGMIVSAINTTVTVLNDSGSMLKFRSLFGMTANELGILDRFYDPKVTYDPIADRFILVFLEGSESSDTRIIVGFTETNDATGDWNFYALNGKPLGGATWSDYPIIAQNATDLYITVNLLRDNESWQAGFVQSFIWQVNKQDGYDGKTNLTQNLFSDITFGGKSVWSICPVQPGLDWNQNNMYFLSVRPDAKSNDSVFLHEITNTSTSGQAAHKLSVLRSDKKYGVPPTAYQPIVAGSDFRLQTNDTRVLSAFWNKGDIQYVQSTVLPDEIRSGIYHGIIKDVATNPTVTADFIRSPTLDFAYPSIAFVGDMGTDKNGAYITFSHVGETMWAGTSAVYFNMADGYQRHYSEIVRVKEGDSVINTFVPDSMERWGDYTDIQAKYNEPGVAWLCGSYGDSLGRNNVWIAKLRVNQRVVTLDKIVSYPNPAESSVCIGATFAKDEEVTIRLTDMRGTIVKESNNLQVRTGTSEFLFNISGVSSGAYLLTIIGADGKPIHSQKIMAK